MRKFIFLLGLLLIGMVVEASCNMDPPSNTVEVVMQSDIVVDAVIDIESIWVMNAIVQVKTPITVAEVEISPGDTKAVSRVNTMAITYTNNSKVQLYTRMINSPTHGESRLTVVHNANIRDIHLLKKGLSVDYSV